MNIINHSDNSSYFSWEATNFNFLENRPILNISNNFVKRTGAHDIYFSISLNYQNPSTIPISEMLNMIKDEEISYCYDNNYSDSLHSIIAMSSNGHKFNSWDELIYRFSSFDYYTPYKKLNIQEASIPADSASKYLSFIAAKSKLFINNADKKAAMIFFKSHFFITRFNISGDSIIQSLKFRYPFYNNPKYRLGIVYNFYDARSFFKPIDIIHAGNNLIIVNYSTDSATYYNLDQDMRILKLKFLNNSMLLFGVNASESAFYIMKLNAQMQTLWLKRITFRNIDLGDFINIKKFDNKIYFFITAIPNITPSSTIIIECDDAYNPLFAYSLPYYVSDVKLSQDTFYIAGNYLYKGKHTPFIGYLFMDNQGSCTLDTACFTLNSDNNLQLTKTETLPLLSAPKVTLEDYFLKEDSIEFELQARDCPTVPENKAIFTVSDTVCNFSQLNPYLQDASSIWKLYKNTNLVDQDTGRVPHFTHYTPIVGTYVIDHIVFYAGCKYRHSDSTFLSSHYGSINSSLDKLCMYDTATFTFTHPLHTLPTSVKWFTSSGELLGSGDSIHITQPGKYIVQLQNKHCQWTDSITIQRRQSGCSASVYIPNAFTPNHDKINDIWKLFSNQPIDAEIEIYDRWGECVYTCSGRDCAWDGTFKQEAMPAGIYVYRIKARLPLSEKVIKKTGTLVLLR